MSAFTQERLLQVLVEICRPSASQQQMTSCSTAASQIGVCSVQAGRVRVGVGRPDSTDPEIVAAHVLARFSEPREEVAALIETAAGEAEGLIERIAAGEAAEAQA